MEKKARKRATKAEFTDYHRCYLATRAEHPPEMFDPDRSISARYIELNARALAELRLAWQALGSQIMREYRQHPEPPEISGPRLLPDAPSFWARRIQEIAARVAKQHFDYPPLGLRLFGEPTRSKLK